jgi:hypothetical protein
MSVAVILLRLYVFISRTGTTIPLAFTHAGLRTVFEFSIFVAEEVFLLLLYSTKRACGVL